MDHQPTSPMADLSTSSSAIKALFIIFELLLASSFLANGCYTSIISFGDSLADTGNMKQIARESNGQLPHFLFPPYGETFFHYPTGRCSNGRLIIDFLAESLRMPFIPPYMGGDVAELGQGVNYAVAGAMAWDSMTNGSLGVQLEWFKKSLPSICHKTKDCRRLIGRSLILMGEIGGNDYYYALETGKSLDEVHAYVPLIIKTIISAVHELIEFGAKTLVIPGNLPIGCSAAYLTMYYDSDMEYDNSTGCLISLNKFAEYHNKHLQTELNQIRKLHPNVNIIYADYYSAAMQFFRSPHKYGFTNGALKACCGGGGPFNYNPSVACGDPSSTSCAQPHAYANWDGIHLTEAAYHIIFKSLFQGAYTTPRFNALCPTLSSSM